MWQTTLTLFSADQKTWLSRGGSLTQHLQTLGHVEIRVMREAIDQRWMDEPACLSAHPRAPVWVREVLLLVNRKPFVAARSITPLVASRRVWRAIRRLRTRPLAALLYDDRTLQRTAFAYQRIGCVHPLYRFACRSTAEQAHCLFARRSVFTRQGAPLLVTECMLTALWTHLAKHCNKNYNQAI